VVCEKGSGSVNILGVSLLLLILRKPTNDDGYSVVISNAHLCRYRISTSSATDHYHTYTTLNLRTRNISVPIGFFLEVVRGLGGNIVDVTAERLFVLAHG